MAQVGSDLDGGQTMLDGGSIVAGNEHIHAVLMKTLKQPLPKS